MIANLISLEEGRLEKKQQQKQDKLEQEQQKLQFVLKIVTGCMVVSLIWWYSWMFPFRIE